MVSTREWEEGQVGRVRAPGCAAPGSSRDTHRGSGAEVRDRERERPSRRGLTWFLGEPHEGIEPSTYAPRGRQRSCRWMTRIPIVDRCARITMRMNKFSVSGRLVGRPVRVMLHASGTAAFPDTDPGLLIRCLVPAANGIAVRGGPGALHRRPAAGSRDRSAVLAGPGAVGHRSPSPSGASRDQTRARSRRSSSSNRSKKRRRRSLYCCRHALRRSVRPSPVRTAT